MAALLAVRIGKWYAMACERESTWRERAVGPACSGPKYPSTITGVALTGFAVGGNLCHRGLYLRDAEECASCHSVCSCQSHTRLATWPNPSAVCMISP